MRNFQEKAGSVGSGVGECVLAVRDATAGVLALHLYDTTGGECDIYSRLHENGLYRLSTKSYVTLTKTDDLGDEHFVSDGLVVVKVGNYAVGVDGDAGSRVSPAILTELAKLMLQIVPESGRAARPTPSG